MKSSRMLKEDAGFVLTSLRPSTYPRGYASALHSLRLCRTSPLNILLGSGGDGSRLMCLLATKGVDT